jgi:hypothetical protein
MVPPPITAKQSVGLTQENEVKVMLMKLAEKKSPNETNLGAAAKKISKHFAQLETEQVTLTQPKLPVLPLIERLQLLNLASPTQRNLFFHVRDSGSKGISESEICKTLPLKYNRHGEPGDPELLISPSEYYFRLRELYLLGLLDMDKTSFYENRWWVRDEISSALVKTPFWGAPRIHS